MGRRVLGNEAGAGWVLAGSLLYTVGCAGLTMVANVPLNNELARQDPDDPRAVEVWQRFLSRWTMWNTVRTVAALAAAALLIIGAIAGR